MCQGPCLGGTKNEAGHAFANPSGTRYNKKAAQDAWNKTKAFFEENLK
jgi:carboxymethylenebutenolidase